ncbi:hypothetical protein COB55_05055 [Candidatus Wolfebacteria bacterium]|nr:MAG: hypothetical protein COB55_05055 [Candidatus Wolfebacteria bacterium]
MISSTFSAFVYDPIYNALILIINVVPGGNLGIAVVLVTVLVKLILFPLSRKAVVTQMRMKELDAPMKEIKEKYKDNKEMQALEMMALYKSKGVNPFATFFLVLLQIPIILGLYFVFLKGGLPVVNTDILYSFVKVPEIINMSFLGFIDIAGKSWLLALFAGLTQYFQVKYSVSPPPPRKAGVPMDFKEDLARNMHIQMRYVLPVIVFFIAYTISAAIALYWTTSNLFMLSQEIFVRRKIKGAAARGTVVVEG